MSVKKQQQLRLFDDMHASPLFSGTPVVAKNGGTYKPQAQTQQRLPATCHFCGDTGRTSDGFCWCEAGQRARPKKNPPGNSISGPMKKGEFNRLLRQCSGKNGILSKAKIATLDNQTKNRMISTIVRTRHPIIVDLLNNETNMAWLHACGYFERSKGQRFEFLCTSENRLPGKGR